MSIRNIVGFFNVSLEAQRSLKRKEKGSDSLPASIYKPILDNFFMVGRDVGKPAVNAEKTASAASTVLGTRQIPSAMKVSSALSAENDSHFLTAPLTGKSPIFSELLSAQKCFAELSRDPNWRSSEVLVAQGTRILLHERSGNIPIDTQYMIGSVSKQFSAVALLKAIHDIADGNTEEEKTKRVEAQLQRPIADFLPENSAIWKWNKGQIPKWATEISLHQLLSHTSGIPNYIVSPDAGEWNHTGNKFHELPHSASEVIQLISEIEFLEKEKFNYSNTNYRIISEIIESISGMTSSEYIERRLCAPLEMSSTFSPTRGRSEELMTQPNYSKLAPELSFNCEDGKYSSDRSFYEDIGVAIGDGSIISTARDLVKWNQALHYKQSVLPKSLYKILTSIHAIDSSTGRSWGYGFMKTDGGQLSHTGLISSYGTELHYNPKYNVSVIVFTSVADTTKPGQQKNHKDPFMRIIEVLSQRASADKSEWLLPF